MKNFSHKPILSICIPAYKRKDYVVETLESIVSQGVKGIEIVVVDDASGDGTYGVLKKFAKKYRNFDIKVFKNKERLGFDKNVIKMVSLAGGKFCWLLGDDDKLYDGSINKVVREIKEQPSLSLIYVNYTRWDNLLKKYTSDAMVNLSKDGLYLDADRFFFKPVPKSYFKYLGTNVITMSTNIVNRKLWLKAAESCQDKIGHNFIHCFVVAKMVSDNPKILYLGKPLVQYRSNNHRVWPNDIWKDYNNFFIDFLIEKDFDKRKALEMRRRQRIYEQKEAVLKKTFAGNLLTTSPTLLKLATYGRQFLSKWVGRDT